MENAEDILKRHKTLIATVSLGLSIRQIMATRKASSLAKDVLKDLRKEEIMKWGQRKIR